jgi:Carbohydrate binding domain (family 11)
MRRIALPIAICLLASYGCAASEESVPAGGAGGTTAHGGTPAIGGSLSTGVSGSGVTSAGTSPGTGGVSSTGGTVSTGTAGSPVTGTAGTPTGTAGVTGTGGAPAAATCTMSATATGTPPLIDDFEDGNSDVGAVDGRVGGWFLATDGTGSTTPTAPIAPKPATGGMPGNALHVTGSGLTSWGASLSASITPAMGCYDASKFTGITVMLKGTGSVWVSVLTAAVRGAAEGQRNHYKKQVTLTADWTPVTINFSELTQPGGWGLVVPFDATKVYGVDFGPATAPPTPTAFDFWIDNLSFKM